MSQVELSVIVPVGERSENVVALYSVYRDAVARAGLHYEFVFVIDGHYDEITQRLKTLKADGEPLTIINFSRPFGEATAISAGFQNAKAELIMTLPAYEQIIPDEIPALIRACQAPEIDMVTASRRRKDHWFNQLQARIFNRTLGRFADFPFTDTGCGVRVFRRQVMDEVEIYGDLHRFLPLLAWQQGFQIQEIQVDQAPSDMFLRLFHPGLYLRRALDLLIAIFLSKFNKRPLRFFGLVGATATTVGLLGLAVLIFQRLVLAQPLADRPALLLCALVLVLGVQLVAIGLVGETIIFTHAREIKEYKIREIVN